MSLGFKAHVNAQVGEVLLDCEDPITFDWKVS